MADQSLLGVMKHVDLGGGYYLNQFVQSDAPEAREVPGLHPVSEKKWREQAARASTRFYEEGRLPGRVLLQWVGRPEET